MQNCRSGPSRNETGKPRAGRKTFGLAKMQRHPRGFSDIGLGLVANQLPVRAAGKSFGQSPLRHSCLQRDPGKRRGHVAIDWKFVQPFDQTTRYAHTPGRSHFHIDALETGGNARFHRLDQHTIGALERFDRRARRGQQAIGKYDKLIVGRHQSRKVARRGYRMKPGAGSFRNMLQLRQLMRHLAGDADNSFALERQGKGQLMPRYAGRPNPEESAQHCAVLGYRFEHR